jgi:hypothetical protein
MPVSDPLREADAACGLTCRFGLLNRQPRLLMQVVTLNLRAETAGLVEPAPGCHVVPVALT